MAFHFTSLQVTGKLSWSFCPDLFSHIMKERRFFFELLARLIIKLQQHMEKIRIIYI